MRERAKLKTRGGGGEEYEARHYRNGPCWFENEEGGVSVEINGYLKKRSGGGRSIVITPDKKEKGSSRRRQYRDLEGPSAGEGARRGTLLDVKEG